MQLSGSGYGRHCFGVLFLCAGLAACNSSSSDNGVPGTIDPNDSDRLAVAIGAKLGDVDMQRVENAEPPAADSGNPDNPSIDNLPENETVAPGDSKSISFGASGQSALATLYAKVSGASSYFEAEIAGTQSLSTKQGGDTLELVLEIPDNLGAGQFCVELSVEDDQDRVSEMAFTCFVNQPGGAVLERLQGNWERCDDGIRERVVISGNTAAVEEAEFDNSDCSGPPTDTFNDALELSIGAATISDEGAVVNPFDATVVVSDDAAQVGVIFYDIIFVDEGDNEFRLGAIDGDPTSPEQRPTAIDFQSPGYLRVDAFDDAPPPGNGGGPGDGGEVADRMQGVWKDCSFGIEAILTIDGASIVNDNTLYENENCTGQSFPTGSGVLSFTVGSSVATTGGQVANALDQVVEEVDAFFDEEVGDEIFDIIWINEAGTQLVLGEDPGSTPEARPDTLDFESGSFDRVD